MQFFLNLSVGVWRNEGIEEERKRKILQHRHLHIAQNKTFCKRRARLFYSCRLTYLSPVKKHENKGWSGRKKLEVDKSFFLFPCPHFPTFFAGKKGMQAAKKTLKDWAIVRRSFVLCIFCRVMCLLPFPNVLKFECRFRTAASVAAVKSTVLLAWSWLNDDGNILNGATAI